MKNFQHKNILIIGASSGIGYALAKELLQLGANVYSASRQQPDLSVNHTMFDAGNPQSFDSNFLPDTLDGLVYCPGTIVLKPFQRLSSQDFINDFQVNVLGAIHIIQAALARLKHANGASVVLFSTVAVQTGMSFHASVAASKGALEGLTRSLAAEFAPFNIRVNAIAPSLTNTPLAKNLLSSPEKIEASNKRHPLGRVGSPDDMTGMLKLLLSADSAWMTGQILHIDGGMGNLK